MQNFQLVRKDWQLGSGGGACTYVNTSVHCQPCEFTLDDTGVGFQCINIQTLNHDLKPPNNLLRVISATGKPSIIVGDLNFDLLTVQHSAINQEIMERHGFQQHVRFPTHSSGSLLDHVYSNQKVHVWQTASYYSDHGVIWVAVL